MVRVMVRVRVSVSITTRRSTALELGIRSE